MYNYTTRAIQVKHVHITSTRSGWPNKIVTQKWIILIGYMVGIYIVDLLFGVN